MLFYEASAKIQSCRIVEKYLKNSNGERSIHDQDERIWCDLEDCAIEYSGEHEYKIVVFVCYIDTNISNGRVEFRLFLIIIRKMRWSTYMAISKNAV